MALTATRVPRRFQAVLFDAGGVLVIPSPRQIGPVLAPFGAVTTWAALHRAHYAGMRAIDEATFEDWPAYQRAYVRTAGVAEEQVVAAADALDAIWSHDLWCEALAPTVAVLRQLDERGVPIGVVSNAGGRVEAMLREAGACQVGAGPLPSVRVVVDSGTVGVSKPDPRIWTFADDMMGMAPEATLYIGDSVRNDVLGARAAGLHPLHFDPYGDHPDADHDRIATVAEVLDWLELPALS